MVVARFRGPIGAQVTRRIAFFAAPTAVDVVSRPRRAFREMKWRVYPDAGRTAVFGIRPLGVKAHDGDHGASFRTAPCCEALKAQQLAEFQRP